MNQSPENSGILGSTTVLIVDDSTAMRRIVRRFLENAGAGRILEAKDGKEALEIMAGNTVDLVVSDLNMPRMNGMELLAAVRTKESETPGRVCFVMLTVEAVQKTMNLALEAGADSYIVKPVTEGVFIREILDAMVRSRP